MNTFSRPPQNDEVKTKKKLADQPLERLVGSRGRDLEIGPTPQPEELKVKATPARYT